MNYHKKYCKRILKQYGKNIKCFEERLDNALEDKRISKFSKSYLNSKDIPLSSLYNREIVVPTFLRRGHTIESYQDLKRIGESI